MLWIGKDHTVESFEQFFTLIGKQLSEAIEFVCSDMWKPYLRVIRERCTNAVNILARIHIVAKMNDGVEHSLLNCPGNYSVKIATFRGKTILQTSGEDNGSGMAFWNGRKKKDRNLLVEAAENAHLLAEELRSHGIEAYEFHDRTESIVTIGSFSQAAGAKTDSGAYRRWNKYQIGHQPGH